LDGNSIIEFENINSLYKKYLLLCFIFDGSLNLIFCYIIYYIPVINNIYLFVLKSLVEHIALLLYTFKSYETKYFHFYSQWLFGIRNRNVEDIAHIYNSFNNIQIYQKVIKFAFIYSCIFIIFQIYKIIVLYYYVDAFFFNYFINGCLELYLVLNLVYIFYPQILTKSFFNRKNYKVQITNKENQLNISNLNKNNLENDYKNGFVPLVFINPFSNSNEIFNNIHIGEIDFE
jgi:hypothetical protein